jgi:hypothetical protein
LSELTVLDWVLYVSRDKRLREDSYFAEKILATVSRHVGYQAYHAKERMLSCFRNVPCIPVNGDRILLPAECYLKSVTLFQDLPLVHLSKERAISEQFLISLGVKNHVDISTVFARLNDLNWDQKQLVNAIPS